MEKKENNQNTLEEMKDEYITNEQVDKDNNDAIQDCSICSRAMDKSFHQENGHIIEKLNWNPDFINFRKKSCSKLLSPIPITEEYANYLRERLKEIVGEANVDIALDLINITHREYHVRSGANFHSNFEILKFGGNAAKLSWPMKSDKTQYNDTLNAYIGAESILDVRADSISDVK
jgi:hypothetical protein